MTLRKITKKEELETILTGDMPHRACYVAGPITHVPDYKKNFCRAEKFLNAIGLLAMNPAYMPDGLNYDDYFPTCFAMIDTAYNICLLKGWEHSEGVRRELEHARESDREYCVFELVILTE